MKKFFIVVFAFLGMLISGPVIGPFALIFGIPFGIMLFFMDRPTKNKNTDDTRTAKNLTRPHSSPEPSIDYEIALKAYNKGDYTTALDKIIPLAENGYGLAQTSLGAMYLNGWGVSQDYRQALKWYSRAAEKGDGLAQMTLGAMYLNGWGVQEDNIQARIWLTRAELSCCNHSQEVKDTIKEMIASSKKTMTPA